MRCFFGVALLLFVGCSSVRPHLGVLSALGPLRLRVTSVESSEAARELIENRRAFWGRIFEQSVDPYFQVPRWSERCLKENDLGVVQQTSFGTFLVGKLYLNEAFEPGFCADYLDTRHAASRHFVVLFHCAGSDTLQEVIVAGGPLVHQVVWSKLCGH